MDNGQFTWKSLRISLIKETVNKRNNTPYSVKSNKSGGFAPSFSILHSPFSIKAR